MKTRILGLLLLVAMLLTAIPVMAAAEEVTPDAGVTEEASEATPELYTLYTDRGLVALYTAFSNDGSVDLANGTWANKVAGGASAILRDESTAGNYWTMYEMGVGYSMTLQQYDDAHATRNPGGLGDARRVGLTLPDAYYTDNFTVDAFAKVIGVTEEDGSVAVRSNEGDLYVDKTSAFRFGIFSGFAFALLRGDTVSGEKVYDYFKRPTALQKNNWAWGYSSSLGVRWFMQNVGFKNAAATAPAYQVTEEKGFLMARGHHSDASTDQTIPVAAVMHLEKVTVEGATRAETTVTYKLTYNVNQQIRYNSNETHSFGVTATVTGDVYDGIRSEERTEKNEYAEGDLSLFNALPSQIYAIRVYADALTEEEKAINRMVDLLYYYGIDVPAYFFEADVLSTVAYMANDIVIVADEAKTAATKKLLQDTLNSRAASAGAIDGYAAPEDLVAFFTTSIATSIDLAAGTWTDIIGGSVATLEGKTNWAFRENGSLGFDAWGGFMSNGTYTIGKTGFAGDTTAYIGNKYRLLFDINMLPDEDFTVEYLAAYRPVLIADADKTASGGKVVYYQENGANVAAYDYAAAKGVTVNTPGSYVYDAAGGLVNDIFGFFSAFTRTMDGTGGWSTTPRGSMWWAVGMSSHQNPTYQQFLGGGWAPVGESRFTKANDAYHVVGGASFNTYGASVDETIVGEHTQALFTIYRDGAKYADNSAKINSTANNAAADVVKHTDTYYYFKGDDNRIYYKSGSTYYDDITGEVKPDSVTLGSQTAEEWGTAYYDCDFTELKGLYGNVRSGFWLSAGTPTDFVVIRVYNRALTQAEREHNSLVDLLKYYDVSIDASLLADASFVSELVYTLSNFVGDGIVTDVDKKAAAATAIKKAVSALVDTVEGAEKNDYASLYVTESETGAKLIGLYTAFGKYTVDFANSVWKNEVAGGANATIRDTGSQRYWHRDGKGIGYTFHYTTAYYRTSVGSIAGTNDFKSPNSDYDEVGIKLPDSYATLDNFTVESFATVAGATDDTGKRWQHENQLYTTIASFRFGLLGSVAFQGLRFIRSADTGEITSYYYTNAEGVRTGFSSSSLAVRWLLSKTATPSISGENKDDLGLLRVGDNEANHLTPVASVMQVQKTTGADTVDYKISYNNESKVSQVSSWGDFRSVDISVAAAEYATRVAKAYGTVDQKTGAFSLYNNLAATVYAIRVYNGTLTAAEKTQNRLADLMYYHGVDVPAGLADNAAALAAIASVADTIDFSYDATKTAANKATIEAAIDAALVSVTVTANGETLSTEKIATATYTLPAVIGGMAAVAYTVDGEAVLPGTAIDASADITAEVVRVGAPKSQAKAGLRIEKETADMGLRFLADISTEDFKVIKAAYGLDAITVGMLITPVKYVELANGVFTREALNAMVASYSSSSMAAYVEVFANGFYASDDETCTIAGSLYKFSATTMAKNPAFTAVAFIDIDADLDGEADYTIYGNYNASLAARVTTVAEYARPFATSEQKGWIDTLLSRFGA